MSSPWFRMDQLLKCGVCSDRIRNPKLLPCNHTFCSDPCLSRLVERSKQQLKCPECSAEHRVPTQGGVHGFPNNVTLVRFLELRQQVSGREPDLPACMQRCNTCKEKGQLEVCAHCNRKVCKDCKLAHVNILRKEIALINEQVRQGLKQLSVALTQTEENAEKIQKNYVQVKDEIEEVVRRYTRDLLDTEARLKHDLNAYLQSELQSMKRLEHDLQVELVNVNSNCDLVDKYVNNGVDWTDVELTDYKEIFQKTLDFLRNFDTDPTDAIRKVKFHARADPDVVHKTLIDFAEVKVNDDGSNSHNSGNQSNGTTNTVGPTLTLTPPQNSALARSQSDNRLASQKGSKADNRNHSHNDDVEREGYRRGKDRFARDRESCEREISNREDSNYLGSSWRRELEDTRSNNQRSRFASREFLDEFDGDAEISNSNRRSIRFEESSSSQQVLQPVRDHVTETEDATKGPLSGVIKILDSPHVMEKLHHSEVRQKKEKEEEERKARLPPPLPPPVRTMTRQMSEDEIEKQKKENKAAAAAAAPATPVNTTPTNAVPATNTKVSSTSDFRSSTRSSSSPSKKEDDIGSRSFSSRYSSSLRSSDDTSSRVTSSRNQEDSMGRRSHREEAVETPPSRLRSWRTTSSASTEKDGSISPTLSPTRSSRDIQKPPVSPRQRDALPPPRPPSRPSLTKSSSLDCDSKSPEPANTTSQRRYAYGGSRTSSFDKKEEDRPRLHLNTKNRLPSPTVEESSNSSSSESGSDSDSDAAARRGDISPSVNTLLARSAQARRQSASTQARLLGKQDETRRSSPRSWRDSVKLDDDPPLSPRDGFSSKRRTSVSADTAEERSSPYSRLLPDKRRSSITSSSRYNDKNSEENPSVSERLRSSVDSPYSSSASRRNRIARSKSSHDLVPGDLSPDEDSFSTARSRIQSRRSKEKSPEDNTNSWSQYLRNKYSSNRNTGGGSSASSYALARSRTSAGLAARSGSDDSSDEDTTTSRRRDLGRHGDSGSPRGYGLPRRTYMQKGKPSLKIGSRGTDSGFFTWPRGVCAGSDNTIVVADSSNHRVQVFHSSGKFLQEFGSYGSNDGEFDCLAAVTVNRIGQFIISDRYNHRIQVFDPSGRFVRAFGSEGRSDGRFSYPWGIATDNLGFIYICDKENHRVQVFQGDGTYVTKFGSIGQRAGELEHPHYVAVSTTNRVIVSDSNNHRIQIFDVNGRLLSTFGNEGSDEGQFKYPRGVAVDDQGYIIVGDSGNNRIQVFHPDGTFLKAFGTWGSGDGEFKGLEGIAVNLSGQILVCDRENHRVQVF